LLNQAFVAQSKARQPIHVRPREGADTTFIRGDEFQPCGFSPIVQRASPPGQRLVVGKVTLQCPDLKVPAEIGADALGCRHGTRKSGVIWDFMQEGSAPQ